MKKDKYRFTLKFDKSDEEHQKVVAILNEKGNKKSQYIVSAVLNYINASDKKVLSEADLDYIANSVSERIAGKTIEFEEKNSEDENILLDTMRSFGI